MIGCLYSFFGNSCELEKIILSTSWRQIISLIDPLFKGGLIEGKKIKEFIDDVIKKATFSQLKIPFKAVATDFKTAQSLDNKSCFNNKGLSKTNPYSMVLKSIQFLQYHLAKECLRSADVVIEPSAGNLGLINWQKLLKGRGKNIILEGEKSTKVILPKIRGLIKEKTV